MKDEIINQYFEYLDNKQFPCVAAKAAVTREHIKALVIDNMACPKDDFAILQFLYDFVDGYRQRKDSFHSAVVIFKTPVIADEKVFDNLLWTSLNALSDLDRRKYDHDKRVASNPSSAHFSFSIKEEAFFIIGIHPKSSRRSRKFAYPALVFNPHAEFEKLRKTGKFESLKTAVRKRDILFSGSVNPMLKDFGEKSEVYQYSGLQYDNDWKCPLKN